MKNETHYLDEFCKDYNEKQQAIVYFKQIYKKDPTAYNTLRYNIDTEEIHYFSDYTSEWETLMGHALTHIKNGTNGTTLKRYIKIHKYNS
jgi:hypothetical protein